ncbi:MAG TPA: hypothetical protein VET24_03230, partial [Actinomycetota bacterium]|nr:hypothetical protein [Actinomycetota bacterium]
LFIFDPRRPFGGVIWAHPRPSGDPETSNGRPQGPAVCAAWLAEKGHFLRPHLGGILTACADLDLWPSFAKMLAAYELATEESEV